MFELIELSLNLVQFNDKKNDKLSIKTRDNLWNWIAMNGCKLIKNAILMSYCVRWLNEHKFYSESNIES